MATESEISVDLSSLENTVNDGIRGVNKVVGSKGRTIVRVRHGKRYEVVRKVDAPEEGFFAGDHSHITYNYLLSIKQIIGLVDCFKSGADCIDLDKDGIPDIQGKIIATDTDATLVTEFKSALKEMEIESVVNYKTSDDKVDLYIESKNTVVELLKDHPNTDEEKQRVDKIKNELDCAYIKIPDNLSVGGSIGLMLKQFL